MGNNPTHLRPSCGRLFLGSKPTYYWAPPSIGRGSCIVRRWRAISLHVTFQSNCLFILKYQIASYLASYLVVGVCHEPQQQVVIFSPRRVHAVTEPLAHTAATARHPPLCVCGLGLWTGASSAVGHLQTHGDGGGSLSLRITRWWFKPSIA